MISHNSITSPYAFTASEHREPATVYEYRKNSQLCSGGYEQNNPTIGYWSYPPQIGAFNYGSVENHETSPDQLHSIDPICSLAASNQCLAFSPAETGDEHLGLDSYHPYIRDQSAQNQDLSYGGHQDDPSKGSGQLRPQFPGENQPPLATPGIPPCEIPENIPLTHDFLCANNCDGGFVGLHECFRNKKSLIISCSGSQNCSSIFRTRHEFTRHYTSMHLHEVLGSKRLLDCPVAGCLRVGVNGFTRRDNILQHRRGFHGEDIPKKCMRFGLKGRWHRQLKVAKILTGKGVRRH